MSGSISKWDAATVASRLRNRRRWRITFWIALGLILLSSLSDHLWPHHQYEDDWMRFDGRQVSFAGAINGETIGIDEIARGEITRVRLLGVASFNDQWDRRSAQRLDALLAGRKLTLLLEPTQTRDHDGRLLAYVFTEDSEAISPQLVGEGLAIDDRRMPFAFHGSVDQAESVARRKHLGLWATANWRMMPPWREAWFEQRMHQAEE
ncbi:MAG TPA: thermonuclease family protein [Tepidisphaeraceae bacterium]|jgi:endonuclease YncB( thermonuclease family)|nr:thermonuclease family protein [Tepidisphaeraceae bacterium]